MAEKTAGTEPGIGGGGGTSPETRLYELRTILGHIDPQRGVATFTILSRFRIYRTVTNTTYATQTLQIVSRVVTAINRTLTLNYGGVNTQVVTRIPTNILATVITRTVTSQSASSSASSSQRTGAGVMV